MSSQIFFVQDMIPIHKERCMVSFGQGNSRRVLEERLVIMQEVHAEEASSSCRAMGFLARSWGVSCVLLAVLSVMSVVVAAIAGWALNKSMDHALDNVGSAENAARGKAVEAYLLPLSLLASMMCMGSICAGIYHLHVWRTDSLAAAFSIGLVAWLVSMLAAGVALKEIHVGAPRSTKLKVTEVLVVLLALVKFYDLLSLYSAKTLYVKQGAAPETVSKETDNDL